MQGTVRVHTSVYFLLNMMMMQFMGGSPGHTKAMMPQMPQMQNYPMAMQPQQSMKKQFLL